MKTIRSRFKAGWLVLILCSASALTAAATSSHWLPWGKRLFDMEAAKADNEHTPPRDGHSHAGGELHTHDEEEGSGHAHAAGESDNHAGHSHTATDNDHTSPTHTDHEHSDETSLQLSQQAQNNIGVKLQEVRFVPFAKTIRVPATIVTRPGRSRIQVATPLTGTVSRIHHIRGEAVAPDTPLFEIRLTDKETIAAEADFLRMAKELDVVNREVERVRKVAAGGAIAGKALLARQYEQQKLEAQLESQRQRLLLQRLTPEQIDTILGEGQLLHEFTVKATRSPSKRLDDNELFQIEELSVEPGQHVEAGDTLCTLADHRDLHIEGRAFEHDIPNMSQAVRNGWMVTAVFPLPEGKVEEIAGLSIHYLANKIDRQSRTFLFYVLLPNEIVRSTTTGDEASGDQQKFVNWKYLPGLRLQLKIPIEAERPRIVLPVQAVVREGAETYVFERNGDHFDRRTVHVAYRDQEKVVINNDGHLKPGAEVAVGGAYQIHLGIKAKGGAAVDAHAGHHH